MLLTALIGTMLQMTLGDMRLNVEIADTFSSREKGLMGRDSLKENHGMLFVYEKPEMISFWMKNTRIPLSVGFFNREKQLFQIEDMDPQTLKPHPSSEPAQYALEVPRNWFKEHKISLGEKFTLQIESGQ